MRKTFLEFLALRESAEAKKAATEVKLSDSADFKPFVIDSRNSGLRAIVKAFLNSDKVHLPGPDGFPHKLTTIEPSKGETHPKLKKKSLYLVGGAVRDHLLGKTPKDFDLATDATPDEIRLILRHAGFTEVKPQTGKHAPIDKKYEKHPEAGNKNRIFYAKGWDRGGREFVIGAKVNGTEYEIATFRKDSKGGDGRTPDRMEFAGLDEDAARRDLTINSMYIPLTNPDGPNTKLIDPHGGAHHLRAGEVHFVGNAKERLEEDQLRALRYIRAIAAYGKNTKIPEEVKEAIADIKDLPAVSRERIREEFLKGLKHLDVNPVHYFKLYKDLGVLNTVFPDLDIKLDAPEDFSDKKEPRLAIAWLLRNNPPYKIRQVLHEGKWQNDEIEHIVHLVELANWLKSHNQNPEMFFNKFFDIRKNHARTGMVDSFVKEWGKMNKLPEDKLHKFLTHDLSTPGYVDNGGIRTVNPEIISYLGGKTPVGQEFGHAIKGIETDKFRKSLQELK